MAFGNSPLIDDFNRGDGSIGGDTCSNGVDAWSTLVIEGDAATGLVIASNELDVSGGASDGWITSSFGPDMEIWVDIVNPPDTGNYVWIGARIQSASSANWDAYYLIWIAGTGWEIREVTNVTPATLAGPTTGNDLVAGDGFGFELVGDSLKGYRRSGVGGSWAEVISTTDGTITGAGNIGISMQGPAGTTLVDNLHAGAQTTPEAVTLRTARSSMRW